MPIQNDTKTMVQRRFYLQRETDESGVSGIGQVAYGVQFADGMVVLRWCVPGVPSGTTVYESTNAVERVHGHNGKTQIVWLDSDHDPSRGQVISGGTGE